MAVYVHINSHPNGSTGTIMLSEHRRLIAEGHESHAFWGRGRSAEDSTECRFATDAEVNLDVLLTRLDGRAGFHSKPATRRLLAQLDEISPDVVHLHNLHGYYMNIEMLFDWLSTHDVRVVWTLHDCWAFTGHCAYFTHAKCAQWKSHCAHERPCCQTLTYPKSYSKHSVAKNFDDKKRLFNLIPDSRMTIILPSHWLEGLVSESFLSKYSIEVRHNTIDMTIFKPTPSDFRERYSIGNRFMVLGVASPWTERKGLGDFVRLAAELDDGYAVVLVGLSKKQKRRLSKHIVGIERTDSQEELVQIYSAADLFVNPSCEETYGMTVAESAACGTPVAVVNGTACIEASEGAERYVLESDLGDLRATVVAVRGGGCLVVILERTSNQRQLAAIYSAADVLFNPTYEDNYPTVNLEAEACGTAVVTYDVGGCAETLGLATSRVLLGAARR